MPKKLEPAFLLPLFQTQCHESLEVIDGPRQNEKILILANAAIFYPSSDVPASEKSSLKLAGIGNHITLAQTLKIAKASAYQDKTLYIPVTEERNGRKHFVLLEISANRQEATLYDSKNAPNCFLKLFCRRSTYPTRPIATQVNKAFPDIKSADFQTAHVGSQPVTDDYSCGYQVVAMLTYLTQQQSLDARKIRSRVEELKEVSIISKGETDQDQDYDVQSLASHP